MKYTVIIEEGVNSFKAYVPDLPDCVAVGDSHADVMRSIRESVMLHLQELKDQGKPIPAPATIGMMVDVAA